MCNLKFNWPEYIFCSELYRTINTWLTIYVHDYFRHGRGGYYKTTGEAHEPTATGNQGRVLNRIWPGRKTTLVHGKIK